MIFCLGSNTFPLFWDWQNGVPLPRCGPKLCFLTVRQERSLTFLIRKLPLSTTTLLAAVSDNFPSCWFGLFHGREACSLWIYWTSNKALKQRISATVETEISQWSNMFISWIQCVVHYKSVWLKFQYSNQQNLIF